MRTLLRTRKQLVRERAQHVQRIQKAIDTVNAEVGVNLEPFRAKVGRLRTMPGLRDVAGERDGEGARLAATGHCTHTLSLHDNFVFLGGAS